jgi:hypothetical protein
MTREQWPEPRRFVIDTSQSGCTRAGASTPTLVHEQLTAPMQHQDRLLCGRLDWDEPHGRSRHCLTNRLGIRHVVLVALHVGLHVARRHHPDLMAQRRDLARPIVRRGTGLHPYPTRRQLLEKGQNLPSSQLSSDHSPSRTINPMNLENVLRKVQTNRANFFHWAAPSS